MDTKVTKHRIINFLENSQSSSYKPPTFEVLHQRIIPDGKEPATFGKQSEDSQRL